MSAAAWSTPDEARKERRLWPGHVLELATHLDRLGYHRLWTTEHHAPRQSASPTVLAAAAAGRCPRMRIGTAGVMLPIHSPRKVAEDFKLLELLYPGRVDLGVLGVMPKASLRDSLLDGRLAPSPETHGARVEALLQWLDSDRVGPHTATRPQVWVCGTSERSAMLAASVGVGFAFHHRTTDASGAVIDGPARVRRYRESFRPSRHQAKPRAVVACYGMCAEDTQTAAEHWFPAIGLDPDFLGSPASCARRLSELAGAYAVSELVVQSIAHSVRARLTSYRLLAEALDLQPGVPALASCLRRSLGSNAAKA